MQNSINKKYDSSNKPTSTALTTTEQKLLKNKRQQQSFGLPSRLALFAPKAARDKDVNVDDVRLIY